MLSVVEAQNTETNGGAGIAIKYEHIFSKKYEGGFLADTFFTEKYFKLRLKKVNYGYQIQ
jgi:hypothetical protein